MIEDHDIKLSRAVEPFFYEAPYPEWTGYVPHRYQHVPVEYGLAHGNILIGDAPGVGKSAECILLSNAEEAKTNLVICPASLRLNWEREARFWSNIENVTTYPVIKSSDGVSTEANYVIISYDLLRNPAVFAAIMAHRWDHLILDEAHYLKDPKGNTRTRPITAPDGLPSVCGRITMASGTILPNQPIECYNAIRLLNWDAIDGISLADFQENYYDLGGGMVRSPVLKRDPNTGQEYYVSEVHWSNKVRNRPKNLDDLQYRLRKHLMVRRIKDQVLHELPARQWHPFPLATTPEMRKALKHPGWKQAETLYKLDPDGFARGMPVDGAISTARRELGEAKAPAIADYAEQLLEEGVTKLVIGAWHHSVLEVLTRRLEKHGLVYMDGSTSTAKKQAAVDKFQNDDRIKIILGQMQPLGMGWTLTAAQDVILAEPYWVPGQNDQLLDRIHRQGQTGGHVIGHIPVVPGTLDEDILATAIEKDQNIYLAQDAPLEDYLASIR